jgi:antitoxin ParD1/3/4
MNVSLTPELAKFVAKEVNSGMYQTASEVVRAALRHLKENREPRKTTTTHSLEELEERLAQGIARLDRGEGVDADEIFERLNKRIAKARVRG